MGTTHCGRDYFWHTFLSELILIRGIVLARAHVLEGELIHLKLILILILGCSFSVDLELYACGVNGHHSRAFCSFWIAPHECFLISTCRLAGWTQVCIVTARIRLFFETCWHICCIYKFWLKDEKSGITFISFLLTFYLPFAASPVDSILDKEDYTLEELLDEDELIQECKSLNSRLTMFLKQKESVDKLVRLIRIRERACIVRWHNFCCPKYPLGLPLSPPPPNFIIIICFHSHSI